MWSAKKFVTKKLFATIWPNLFCDADADTAAAAAARLKDQVSEMDDERGIGQRQRKRAEKIAKHNIS